MSFSNVCFDRPKHTYAVFTYSLKPNKSNVDCLIVVLPIKRCVQAQSERGFERKKALVSKKWARLMKFYRASEGVQFFRNASEAYAYAIEMRDKVPTARLAHIYRDGERSFNVYCHPLELTVKEDGDFKRQNRNRSLSASFADCFYVGQTGLPVEERLDNHMDPENRGKTKWGQKHFVGRDHLGLYKRGRAAAERLTRLFEEATGLPTSNLLYSESIVTEAAFANWIRSKGHQAYFA